MDYQDIAKSVVSDYVVEHLDKSDGEVFTDIYVVWFSKTLQNWKCLLSTNLRDGMYYEVTFNGMLDELYLDAYKKFENRVYSQFGKYRLPGYEVKHES